MKACEDHVLNSSFSQGYSSFLWFSSAFSNHLILFLEGNSAIGNFLNLSQVTLLSFLF